ncbi:MAG: xanthine dehydrogenase family protein molybdopterin-binding subunit [Deltaproteobacteria bacterium]|nr:xanthine dehydrogenase family protein molybdopterin-binding subunit [Deltaproteobacteria bacterium]
MKGTWVAGTRVTAIDAAEKTTGQTKYLQDLRLPGLLVGKVLRSPHPHARLRRVSAERARRVPGVRAVVTGADTPGIKFGIVIPDEWALAVDRVLYVGDEVAAVAAVDEEAAREALALIEVEYEPLPPVFDVEEALRPGAPRLHDDKPGNLATGFLIDRGDVDQAFRESDVLLGGTYRTQMQHQGNLEPICCMAEYAGGRLTLWGPLQSPFLARQYLLAKPLGLSEGQVRIIQTPVGGAFGGKLDEKHYLICALLALHAGRPVRLANSYAEELTTTRPRMPAILRIKSGWSKAGMLRAKQVEVLADNGAYSSLSPSILSSMAMRTDSLYRTPAARVDAKLVYTNNLPSGQMRGFGNPQATFAWESHIDEVAEALGMDPVELRLRNATEAGDVTVHGWEIASCGLKECIAKAAEGIGWKEQRANRVPNRGVGLACTIHVTSNKPFATSITGYEFDGSSALVKVEEDGQVFVATGEVDLGEGVTTTLALIAAEELGVPLAQVRVLQVDTDSVPYGLGTYASRTTFMGGHAVRLAAADAKRQLFELAADLLEANVADLEAREGRIAVRGAPERGIAVAEVARAGMSRGRPMIVGRGTYESQARMQDVTHKYGNQTLTYSFACQAVEVEVDPETGRVRVLRVVAAHDLGRAINPVGAEGQIEGGVVQAVGLALSEELQQREGRIRNPGFLDYKIPSVLDATRVESILVETIDPHGPYGAKGVAETAINPGAAAIANAVYHAVGVRVRELPLTAENVRAALGRADG